MGRAHNPSTRIPARRSNLATRIVAERMIRSASAALQGRSSSRSTWSFPWTTSRAAWEFAEEGSGPVAGRHEVERDRCNRDVIAAFPGIQGELGELHVAVRAEPQVRVVDHDARPQGSGCCETPPVIRRKKWTIGSSDQNRPAVRWSRRYSCPASSRGTAAAISPPPPAVLTRAAHAGLPSAVARTSQPWSTPSASGRPQPCSTSVCPCSVRSSAVDPAIVTGSDDPARCGGPGEDRGREPAAAPALLRRGRRSPHRRPRRPLHLRGVNRTGNASRERSRARRTAGTLREGRSPRREAAQSRRTPPRRRDLGGPTRGFRISFPPSGFVCAARPGLSGASRGTPPGGDVASRDRLGA